MGICFTGTKQISRKTWTTPEKQAVRRRFSTYLQLGSLPTINECYEVIQSEQSLKDRSAEQLKAWVNNTNKKKLKDQKKT